MTLKEAKERIEELELEIDRQIEHTVAEEQDTAARINLLRKQSRILAMELQRSFKDEHDEAFEWTTDEWLGWSENEANKREYNGN